VRPAPRSRAQRKADTLALLRTEVDCWVASADEMGNAHLVPLSHYWDGAALVLATPRSSPTAGDSRTLAQAIDDALDRGDRCRTLGGVSAPEANASTGRSGIRPMPMA
jgi:hypothetical protein